MSYRVGETVRFKDEVTGQSRRANILRVGKEGRQNYYVLNIDYGRIALPSQIRRVKESNSMERSTMAKSRKVRIRGYSYVRHGKRIRVKGHMRKR